MKKYFGIISALMIVLTLCLVPAFYVSADGALDYAEDAPGGAVYDAESFIAALGDDGNGHPNAEAVPGSTTDIRLRSSVIIREPIIIVKGSYRLIGCGCTVARGFSSGPLIMLDGTELTNAPSLTIEKPYETEWSDSVEPSLIFDGNASAYPEAEGAIITVSGHAYLKVNGNVLFNNVSSAYPGGAIYAETGAEGYENTPLIPDVEVRYCKFTQCFSSSGGGAIGFSGYYSGTNEGTVKLTSCIFENNSACSPEKDGKGGAIWSVGGSLEINLCTFTNNKADKGGCIYTCSDTVVKQSDLSYNEANVSGAVLYCGTETVGVTHVTGFLTLDDVNATYNVSSGDGGVLTNEGVTITNSFRVTENEAGGNGGAIMNFGSYALTEGSVFYNKCSGLGGGICNLGPSSVFIMNGGEFNNNKAAFAAGVYSEGSFKMAGGAIGNNKGEGPAVLIKGTFVFGPLSAISNKNSIGLCITTDESGAEYQPYIELSGEMTSLMDHSAYFCREEVGKDGNISGYSYENPKGRTMFTGGEKEIEAARKMFSVYSEGMKKFKIDPDGSVSVKLPLMPLYGWIISACVIVAAAVSAILIIRHKKKTNIS